jgi:DNA-binding IscR family transcriptional regulator
MIDFPISDGAKLLWAYLKSVESPTGIWPTQVEVAVMFGVTERSIQNRVAALVGAGLLTTKRGKNGITEYKLIVARDDVESYALLKSFSVPAWLAVRTEVSSSAKLLYAYLVYMRERGDTGAIVGPETARVLGLPLDDLSDIFAELQKHELVTVSNFDLNGVN